MNHSLCSEGYGIRIRPIGIEDAQNILLLRTLPGLSRFIGETVPDVEYQRGWIKNYLGRADDYYFAIENSSTREFLGTISVYDIDHSIMVGEWGRWIIKPGVMAGPASVLLLLDLAFDRLQLNEVYSRTVASNTQVVSFHDRSCAPRSERQFPRVRLKEGEFDLIVHEINTKTWSQIRANIERAAKAAERFLSRS